MGLKPSMHVHWLCLLSIIIDLLYHLFKGSPLTYKLTNINNSQTLYFRTSHQSFFKIAAFPPPN